MLPKLFETYSEQEIYDARYKNLGANPGESQKIPAILHHILLTNSNNPQDIPEESIKHTINIIKLFSKDVINNWQIKIWINNPDALTHSKTELEPLGVKFHSIFEVKMSEEMSSNVNFVIDHEYWGMGSDALRYLIISQFGGFYADLGADFYRAPGLDLYKYDFIANQWSGILIANNFFAAKNDHPALEITKKIVEENLSDLECIKDVTTGLTAEPFNTGFYSNFFAHFGNTSSSIDVVIPHSKFHNNKNLYCDGIDPDSPRCDLYDSNFPFITCSDICAADYVYIGQDALAGEIWYNKTTNQINHEE